MIQKILIAEDTESTNFGLVQLLKNLSFEDIHHEKYCENALLKIKKEKNNYHPFDVLITDLSFDVPYPSEKIKDGFDLIKAAKEFQPSLKIVVFSVMDKTSKIRLLFDQYNIEAFVLKGTEDKTEITKALKAIESNEKFISSNIAYQVHQQKNVMAPASYDLEIVKRIAQGNSQQEIAEQFLQEGIRPHSLSSIEKRLNILRESYEAKNNPHLIFVMKEQGFI